MPQLHARDYERMLDIVVAVLESENPGELRHLIAEHLLDALDCGTVIFARLPAGDDRAGHVEGWAPRRLGGDAMTDMVQRRIRQRHPLIPYLAVGERVPVTMNQLCGDSRWHNSRWRSEAHRDYGTTDQLALPMPAENGALRAISLGRDGAFTEHDLAFATRIQPLLATADRHVRELHRLREAVAATAPGVDPGVDLGAGAGAGRLAVAQSHGLTPRELTVLGLLSEGITAHGIGRRLTISPHTVNRHLEKIYRKLGTNNRVSTVLLAKQAGIVP
ncbi:helix-turn-helix transcriptional regulator [Streptomyces triculaminicus]|uniref:Helix-turn-helix transcriptional regulator n=1 Tax=Streptomyces triculaminicus TaxID=2816232 RepID=A0A939JQ09_9ACTN|nr:helix-turn-helix transcriptional regulator [Streptomyces triculaminicus]MBO0656936.1 helix-turn-helix transcriptional regulator [Streptomyces triculaminicus]